MTVKEIRAIKAEVLPEAQHAIIDVIQGDRGGYELRRKAQIPLDLYFRRNWISKLQHYAGDRLYKDYRYAGIYCPKGMEIREALSLMRVDRGDKQSEARQRVRQAFDAISGMIAKDMVLNVCCYGYALKGLSLGHYKGSNQKMSRFQEALDDLVMYYDK